MFSNKNFNGKSKDLTFIMLIKSCLLFLLVFISLCVFILVIMSLIFYQSLNPSKMVDLISLSSLFLSAFISAFLLSKANGQNIF